MMLKKKLRNSTILMRTAIVGGLSWPLLGRSVLYISIMNDATMAENKLFCKPIVSGREINVKSVMRFASHQENH